MNAKIGITKVLLLQPLHDQFKDTILVLDNQSMACMFNNPQMVSNVRRANYKLILATNGGDMTTEHEWNIP